MNKKIIDSLISHSYVVLRDTGIAENGNILNGYKVQISTFGAAITMGSLKSAIAFFSKQKGASVNRGYILRAICMLLKIDNENGNERDYGKILIDYVDRVKEKKAKEDIINAAIALKLSMNFYNFKN